MDHLSGSCINPVGSCNVVSPLAKKSQSGSHKRGGRKKTLSLNPEEREALENLIEEVILDGGMGESESGSSDDESKASEEQGSNINIQNQFVNTTLNNPKALASIKMPKKYYPGQLKVALKHMTDLPPRFSRKLKKAERYMEMSAAAAGSKKMMPPAIKEEDEEEVASINSEYSLNLSTNDFRNNSPNKSKSPKSFLNSKSKFSKDNQMKDLKKTIRSLLTDLDQYVDESDRTSLSLDLPGAVTCSDFEKESLQTNASSNKSSKSASQSSEDSSSGINAPSSMPPFSAHSRRTPYIDSPQGNNHSPLSQSGRSRKFTNNSYIANMEHNYQMDNTRNNKSSPGSMQTNSASATLPPSNHFSNAPPHMLPPNMEGSGMYFMPVPQPSSYYHSIPPQNYSIPPPSFLQYPPPRFPIQDQFLSYPPSDYFQPPTNQNVSSFGQVGLQMPANYKVLPVTDSNKINSFVYQTIPPSHQPTNYQPLNHQSPNYQTSVYQPPINHFSNSAQPEDQGITNRNTRSAQYKPNYHTSPPIQQINSSTESHHSHSICPPSTHNTNNNVTTLSSKVPPAFSSVYTPQDDRNNVNTSLFQTDSSHSRLNNTVQFSLQINTLNTTTHNNARISCSSASIKSNGSEVSVSIVGDSVLSDGSAHKNTSFTVISKFNKGVVNSQREIDHLSANVDRISMDSYETNHLAYQSSEGLTSSKFTDGSNTSVMFNKDNKSNITDSANSECNTTHESEAEVFVDHNNNHNNLTEKSYDDGKDYNSDIRLIIKQDNDNDNLEGGINKENDGVSNYDCATMIGEGGCDINYEGSDGKDEDGADGEEGLSIMLSKSFVKKLVDKFSEEAGTDINGVLDTRVVLDAAVLKSLYEAVVGSGNVN